MGMRRRAWHCWWQGGGHGIVGGGLEAGGVATTVRWCGPDGGHGGIPGGEEEEEGVAMSAVAR